ncbi:MAG: hypothetical protein AB8B63_02910 [Granulosicoccus sp.]
MKIKLASTLPFTPVQLYPHHPSPQRAVGQLQGWVAGSEYSQPVYEYRYSDDDTVSYLVDPAECVFFGSEADSASAPEPTSLSWEDRSLQWVEHHDGVVYKPYAFTVMNAMTKLVGAWDGVVYHKPLGERFEASMGHATLQIVDTCVCTRTGLWALVQLYAEADNAGHTSDAQLSPTGWVPLQAA